MNWIRPIPGTPRRLEPERNTRVVEQPVDGDAEPALAPPEGKSLAELQAELREPVQWTEDPYAALAAKEEKPQFTIAELLLLMVCAAIGLAGGRWMPPAVFSYGAAVLAFFMMCLVEMFGRYSPRLRLFMWSMIGIYIAAAVTELCKAWGV